MNFVSFYSSGFITAIIVNPPERKLAKRTSVHYTYCITSLCTKVDKNFNHMHLTEKGYSLSLPFRCLTKQTNNLHPCENIGPTYALVPSRPIASLCMDVDKNIHPSIWVSNITNNINSLPPHPHPYEDFKFNLCTRRIASLRMDVDKNYDHMH